MKKKYYKDNEEHKKEYARKYSKTDKAKKYEKERRNTEHRKEYQRKYHRAYSQKNANLKTQGVQK